MTAIKDVTRSITLILLYNGYLLLPMPTYLPMPLQKSCYLGNAQYVKVQVLFCMGD